MSTKEIRAYASVTSSIACVALVGIISGCGITDWHQTAAAVMWLIILELAAVAIAAMADHYGVNRIGRVLMDDIGAVAMGSVVLTLAYLPALSVASYITIGLVYAL